MNHFFKKTLACLSVLLIGFTSFSQTKPSSKYELGLELYKESSKEWKSQPSLKAYFLGTDALKVWATADTIDYYNSYRLHRDIAAMLAKFNRYQEAVLHLELARPYLAEHLERFPAVAKKYNDAKLLSEVDYFNGLYHRHLGNYDVSLTKLMPLTTSEVAVNNPSIYAQAKNQLGLSYFYFKEYNKAEIYFKDLIKMSGLPNAEKADYLHNLGNTYLKLGQNDKAIDYLKKAATLSELANKTSDLVVNLIDLADAYLIARDPENALIAAKKAADLKVDVSGQPKRFMLYRVLEKASYQSGNTDTAIAFGDMFDAHFKDYNLIVSKVIDNEASLKYELAIAEQFRLEQLAIATAQANRKQWTIALVAFGLIVVLVLAFKKLYYTRKKRMNATLI